MLCSSYIHYVFKVLFKLTLYLAQADYCDWTYSQQNFTRLSPATSNMNQTPPVDHTMGSAEGHYLKVLAVNKNVRLSYNLSMFPSTSSNICIKFYYFMGSPMNTQSTKDYFYVQTNEWQWGDWSANSLSYYGQLDQWQYFRLTLKDVKPEDMLSIGAKISAQSSVIAFDDILVQDLACEQPGWCDFENGLG